MGMSIAYGKFYDSKRRKLIFQCDVVQSIDNVLYLRYNKIIGWDTMKPAKSTSMSIRVSENELTKLKQAAELLNYSSYSAFVRRPTLIEATRMIKEHIEDSMCKDQSHYRL